VTQHWRRPALLIAFLAASTSGLAVLLYAAGWITLNYSLRILAPLTMFAFVALVASTGPHREQLLVTRLAGGLLAGAAGLAAYDLLRLLILASGLVGFNPFRLIEVYGLLILDAPEDTALTKVVGWAFHLWNGLSFAMMYTLLLGRGRLLWALGWGLLLELGTVVSYPSMFGLTLGREFVLVSLSGHLAYGLALGVTARRVVKW
jgi:hypothetical protein